MIRVYVQDGDRDLFVRNVVPVFILQESEDRSQPRLLWQHRTLADGQAAATWATVPDGPELAEPQLGPSLLIPRGEVRAVAEALLQHLDHEPPPGDARALRRDLDHERGRVDRMLEVLLAAAADGLNPS